jgi:polynucleotide 5'-kinase involved in rRNA processing
MIHLKKSKLKKKNKYFKNIYLKLKVNDNVLLKKVNKRKFLLTKKFYRYLLKKKIKTASKNAYKIRNIFSIRFAQNNIFSTFFDTKYKKILHCGNAGVYKLKISKRRMKYFFKIFISKFFKNIYRKKNVNNSIFFIDAPLKYRKKLFKSLTKSLRLFKSVNTQIHIRPKKCFNGCRAKKQIRKKRKSQRIYK